ncbi:MAG: alpha/beta fold hydrolase [Pseudomonadota bacterium]
MTTSQTDWSFGGAWPFVAKWFETAVGKIHYIDEGPKDGIPVVFVHGNPTWSYVYRRFIEAVLGWDFRAIAMDHLGFGRSDKPAQSGDYTIEAHADRCEELLESLDLRDAIIVVQDWGGPIGLPWAARHPDRVSGLFILNTFFSRPTEKVPLPMILKAFRTPIIGDLLVKGAHAFVRGFLFQAGLNNPDRLSRTDRAAYLAPHPTWSSRTGILAFPRQIPSGPQGQISDFVDREGSALAAAFRDRPVKIVWPMKDVAFLPETLEDMWVPMFPDAQIVQVQSAGHFIQEDAHETVIPELMDFIGRDVCAQKVVT